MSNVAGKDDNASPVVFGVSDLDGITPIQIKFNPSTRGMLLDSTTTISFDPTVNVGKNTVNDYPLAMATASATSGSFTANQTVRPWVVNHSTGAVLVDLI